MSNEIATTNNSVNVYDVAAYSTIANDSVDSGLKLAAMLNAAVSLNGHENQEFVLVDVLFKPGVRKGRNGMPDMECTDVYMLTYDGEVFFSQSMGVARSVRNLLAMVPSLNKPEGVRVRLETSTTQNGNTIKYLNPVL